MLFAFWIRCDKNICSHETQCKEHCCYLSLLNITISINCAVIRLINIISGSCYLCWYADHCCHYHPHCRPHHHHRRCPPSNRHRLILSDHIVMVLFICCAFQLAFAQHVITCVELCMCLYVYFFC